MHRAVSVGELREHKDGKPAPPGVNLDAVFNWCGRQVVKGWRALRSEELWSSLFSATTELYHGANSNCFSSPASSYRPAAPL